MRSRTSSQGRARPSAAPSAAHGLALAGAALAGSLGALPLGGDASPRDALVWLALAAAPAGAALGARGQSLWPWGLTVPAVWSLALASVDAGSERDLPAPAWAAAALTGLYAAGFAFGRGLGRAWTAAALAALVSVALALLPSRARLGAHTWGELWPRAAAVALDLSPTALVAECAGLDWMRDPSIYHPAGTDWFSDRREPWRGELAGPAALVLGCLAVRAVRRRRRPGRAAPGGGTPQAGSPTRSTIGA